MTGSDWRCSVEAAERVEPLYATASLVNSWLLIEQSGAWGPDALTDSKFPSEIATQLERRASGVRILLIRRRSASNDETVFFKAHSGGGGREPTLVSLPLHDPADLLDVAFGALADGDVGAGKAIDHPIYLVCTHGRHDVCCADNGRPLYRAVSSVRPDRAWEVSHIGGDRFSGNLLVLPRGDYFGRLEPENAEPLVTRYEAGELDLTHHRGRSTQPRLVQAAEQFLREAESLSGLDDLVVSEYRRADDASAEVVFVGPSGPIRVQVAARPTRDPQYLTCRAPSPGHSVAYHLISITRD